MLAALQHLDAALAELAALDVDTLDDSELHDLVVAVHARRDRLGIIAATPLARWDGRGVWTGDGSRTAKSRLARDCHTSVTTAAVELRRARHLATMPHTAAAVTAGRLSLDHVDLLARANQPWRNSVFADHEAVLVDECAKLRYAQAVRLVDYWCHRADDIAADDTAQRDLDRSHLHASTTLDGAVVINGRLDAVGGAAVTAELSRLERLLYLADQRDGVVRTATQRRAAALIEMARRSAATPADAQRPKPLFTVLLGDDTFTKLCELANGAVVAPGALTPWLGDADMETVLFDGPTTIISVSRRRSFCGAVRRAVEVRDRHCQHPSGCDTPVDNCDVDHIVARVDGGPSCQFNGRLECTTHNRHPDKHDHGATAHPARPIDRLDELRAQLRWRYTHDDGEDSGDADRDPDDGDGVPIP